MNLDEIISIIPGWSDAGNLFVKSIGGLTNSNYLVEVDGDQFVLRVSGKNTHLLGIDRKTEFEVMKVAALYDLCPEVVYYHPTEGHMVTRYLHGRHWTYDEYCKPEKLSCMVEAVKAIHNLPGVITEISPFRRIEHYVHHIKALDVDFPVDFKRALQKMKLLEKDLKADPFPSRGLCHNDLFSKNFIDDGKLRFIDWEFAGMGDIFYDLATLAYTFDSVGEISIDLQKFILVCYFGEMNDYLWSRMEQMKFMILLYSVVWGLLQFGLEQAGITPSIEGFNYYSYAKHMFKTLQENDFL